MSKGRGKREVPFMGVGNELSVEKRGKLRMVEEEEEREIGLKSSE